MPPEFDDLVSDDLDAVERDRLRRVHDLLVDVGPPPDLSLRSAPRVGQPVVVPRRRRRQVLYALAAALGAFVVFTIGLVVASGDEPGAELVVALSGPSGASASLEIFEIDEAGNWPMLLDVSGLRPASEGKRYELWLSIDGKLAALCGSFLTDEDGRAVVPMNAPWRLKDFDGWAVVESGSKAPLLTA
jgi:Anti-sigma-K factor rskA, C-terminal